MHGRTWRLQFIRGSTHFLAQVLRDARRHLEQQKRAAEAFGPAAVGVTDELPAAARASKGGGGGAGGGDSDSNYNSEAWPLRQVVAAGGGAFKFARLFEEAMRIELVALKEFQSLVDGLRLLCDVKPPKELYTVVVDTGGTPIAPEAPRPHAQGGGGGGGGWVEESIDEWPVPLYPFLLVSFGSGVSILQVTTRRSGCRARASFFSCRKEE